jgi:hypothetical protein
MRQTITVITCDLCEGPVGDLGKDLELELLTPAINGRRVRLDLCDAHVTELVDATARFAEAGTPIARAAAFREPARARGARRAPDEVKAIRRWAAEHGYELATRGRIPREVEDAWQRAGGTRAA